MRRRGPVPSPSRWQAPSASRWAWSSRCQAGRWICTTTGVVTFTTAPANGVIVRAGFEFDVPVRFDSDTLDVTLDFERLGSITSIPLLEIRR